MGKKESAVDGVSKATPVHILCTRIQSKANGSWSVGLFCINYAFAFLFLRIFDVEE